ncbi:MAG TPA: thioredoxin domain-containing protein [Polyangiaceae bacterium]|nr:thioredoxin domain-containing protein [Polyangiaceae bacterium]
MQGKAPLIAGLLAGAAALALVGFATTREAAHTPAASSSATSSPTPSAKSAPSAAAGGSVTQHARDTAVWKVPVLPDDPVQGQRDALVTIVAFSELESSFCKKAAETLDQLMKEHPYDLRVVWKDYPQPFDTRALPAALFARAVYQKLGNDAFWRAQDLVFASQPKLENADLAAVASKLGLPATFVTEALEEPALAKRVDQSIALGFDVQAKGIPHLFINGLRLAGAQPLDKVRQRLDEALVKAHALVESGVARDRVYETIIANGQELPPLVQRNVAAPDSNAPAWGAPKAPVVLEFWSAFPCAACVGTIDQLQELEREYGGSIKLVFRFAEPEPLRTLAIEATREAFSQQGLTGLKAWHTRLADRRPDEAEISWQLERASLEKLAEETRLDLARFRAALDSKRHRKATRSDAEAARKAGISAPAFVVNGYYLAGAQPNFALRRAIQHARNASR